MSFTRWDVLLILTGLQSGVKPLPFFRGPLYTGSKKITMWFRRCFLGGLFCFFFNGWGGSISLHTLNKAGASPLFLNWKRNYCKLVPLFHTDLCYRQVIIHFAEQFVGIRIFFPVPLSSVSYMAVLSYLLPVVSCLLLGKVQSVSAVSALTRGALPCDSTVWMPGEALPLLSLLFPTFLIFQPSIFPVCQKDQEHLYPWVDTEINACRATQRHSWSAAFEAISCAWGWWSTLRCQSLPKEQEVPRDSSSRADLGCFKAHVLAHSSTKSTLIYDLQLLIHLSALALRPRFPKKC